VLLALTAAIVIVGVGFSIMRPVFSESLYTASAGLSPRFSVNLTEFLLSDIAENAA
jgi:hypothetical protein